MTEYQKELLAKMKTGRKVTIYTGGDSRTVLHSADGHPSGSERVKNWKAVVALLKLYKVRIVSSIGTVNNGLATTYEAF